MTARQRRAVRTLPGAVLIRGGWSGGSRCAGPGRGVLYEAPPASGAARPCLRRGVRVVSLWSVRVDAFGVGRFVSFGSVCVVSLLFWSFFVVLVVSVWLLVVSVWLFCLCSACCCSSRSGCSVYVRSGLGLVVGRLGLTVLSVFGMLLFISVWLLCLCSVWSRSGCWSSRSDCSVCVRFVASRSGCPVSFLTLLFRARRVRLVLWRRFARLSRDSRNCPVADMKPAR